MKVSKRLTELYKVVKKITRVDDFEQQMNISLRNKYVFFVPSKCASSTIKTYLQHKELERTGLKVQDVDKKMCSPLLSSFQMGDELHRCFSGSEFKRVTFARHPLDRLIANYVYKVVGARRGHPSKQFRKQSGIQGDVSFKQFVRFICSQKSSDMNAHWRPITDTVLWDYIKYDFVGKVETIKDSITDLGRFLYGGNPWVEGVFDRDGSPLIIPDIDPYVPVNTPLKHNKTILPVQELVEMDSEIADLINHRYERDFVNFGYDYIQV